MKKSLLFTLLIASSAFAGIASQDDFTKELRQDLVNSTKPEVNSAASNAYSFIRHVAVTYPSYSDVPETIVSIGFTKVSQRLAASVSSGSGFFPAVTMFSIETLVFEDAGKTLKADPTYQHGSFFLALSPYGYIIEEASVKNDSRTDCAFVYDDGGQKYTANRDAAISDPSLCADAYLIVQTN